MGKPLIFATVNLFWYILPTEGREYSLGLPMMVAAIFYEQNVHVVVQSWTWSPYHIRQFLQSVRTPARTRPSVSLCLCVGVYFVCMTIIL